MGSTNATSVLCRPPCYTKITFIVFVSREENLKVGQFVFTILEIRRFIVNVLKPSLASKVAPFLASSYTDIKL